MEASLPIGDIGVGLGSIIFLVCILIVAFFSSSEAGILSVRLSKIESLAKKGDKKAKTISKLLKNHSKLFATILLTENLFIIFASSIGTIVALKIFGEKGLLPATLIMTVVIVAFSEITPKTYAAKNSLWIARNFSPLILWITKILTPITWLFTHFTKLIIFILPPYGKNKRQDDKVTEGEIKTIIQTSEKQKAIEKDEAEMLKEVFDFHDLKIKNVMISLEKIVTVSINTTIGQAIKIALDCGHSRIPVVEKNKEKITGVLYTKDLLKYFDKDPERKIRDITRTACIIKADELIDDGLKQMQKSHCHLFIVEDKQRTVGIVTIEDLLEEIVGEIYDEYDKEM